MSIHIYTASMQPATDWTDNNSDQPRHGGYAPDATIYPLCCNKRRAAADCVVQCFYDGLRIWCAPDKGCHDPAVVAAKKAREFARRSAGQKARWAKARAAEDLEA